MAGSGSFNTGAYSGRYLQFAWTARTSDIVNNKTTIDWTLKGAGGSSSWYMSGNFKVVIDGVQVYYSSERIQLRNGTVVASGSYTLKHDNLGNKSFSASAEAGIYSTAVNCRGSGSWSLPNIPRKATITSAPNFTDLDNPTIRYSNPAGNAVTTLVACISLVGNYPDIEYRDIPKTASTYTFSLTDAQRDLLRNATTSGSKTVTFIIKTITSGSTFFSTVEKTFSVQETDATKPELTVTAAANNGSLGTAFQGIYIQGKSKVDVTLSVQTKYNASIGSYSTVADGKTYTASSFTSDFLSATGNQTITSKVTDSRGFSALSQQELFVYSYSKPYVVPTDGSDSVECYRGNADGGRNNSSTKIWVKAKRNYTAITADNSQKNFCSLRWRYKSDSESWGNQPWNDLIVKSNTDTDSFSALIPDIEFPITNAYTIQLGVADDIGESSEISFDIPTDDVPLHLGQGGKNTAVGRYCDYTKPYSFQVGWESIFEEDVSLGKNLSVTGNTVIQGSSLADFVIEEGIGGNWNYRKWNNGLYECWLYTENVSASTSAVTKDIAFPISFVSLVSASVSPIFNAWNVASCYMNQQQNMTEVTTAKLAYFAKTATSMTYGFNIQIVGKWK